MDQDDKNDKGIDLSGALKDSGTGVKFEEYRAPRSNYSETHKIIQWVMKYSGGLVKDEEQASYVILGFFGLSLVIMIILFSNAFSGPSEPPAGFRGNIPNTPEYQNPPRPEDLR